MQVFGREISTRVRRGSAAVLVVVVGAFLYCRSVGQPLLTSDINFVCVSTGRTYTVDRDDIDTLPLINPKTDERSLLPCVERDGRLYADARYRGLLLKLRELNRYVDEDTLLVRTTP